MRKANVFPKCNSWEEMFLLSEDAKIPTHWQFGKYRGKPLRDAPKDYINWYLKLPVNETDSYLVKALKSL
jgi:exodeoxyribonuclease X